MATTTQPGEAQPPAARCPTQDLEAEPAGRRGLRVLVADGDRDTADSLALLVALWGHTPVVTYDGADALRLALAHRPDVLMLDVALPGLSGCDVARRARQEGRLSAALMVAITGHTGPAHCTRAAEAGFNQYLLKPACPLHLETMLRRERARVAGPAEP